MSKIRVVVNGQPRKAENFFTSIGREDFVPGNIIEIQEKKTRWSGWKTIQTLILAGR